MVAAGLSDRQWLPATAPVVPFMHCTALLLTPPAHDTQSQQWKGIGHDGMGVIVGNSVLCSRLDGLSSLYICTAQMAAIQGTWHDQEVHVASKISIRTACTEVITLQDI